MTGRTLSTTLLVAALAFAPVVRSAEAPAAGGAAAPAAKNEIETLVQQRKYDQALVRVRELRAEAKKPIADAESEFWAARAEGALKQPEAARQRFLAIAAAYPGTKRGNAAAIEATTTRINALGEGRAETPEELRIASDSAKELEATAARLDDPESISRALYVAGNSWRLAENEDAAARAFTKAAEVAGAKDYPGKALYSLSTRALQHFDVPGAQKFLNDCIRKFPESSSLEKCGKALTRIGLIGSPAPPLRAETWVVGPPQDIEALRGRVVVLWFFATWCPHCKATMPEMAALKERFAGKPLTFIGMTHNSKDQTTEGVKAFVADPKYKLTYPTAVDDKGATTMAYEGGGIPAAVLIDKKGIIRWADHPTYLNDAMVARLLAE